MLPKKYILLLFLFTGTIYSMQTNRELEQAVKKYDVSKVEKVLRTMPKFNSYNVRDYYYQFLKRNPLFNGIFLIKSEKACQKIYLGVIPAGSAAVILLLGTVGAHLFFTSITDRKKIKNTACFWAKVMGAVTAVVGPIVGVIAALNVYEKYKNRVKDTIETLLNNHVANRNVY